MSKQQEAAKNSDHTLAWVEQCLNIARQKASALLQNNLGALEECLELEAQLLARRPIFHKNRPVISRSLLLELRSLNRTNRALIANGLDLSRRLLETIHPPATYSASPSQTIPSGSIGPAISVKC
jgi:hypothetical protein